MNKILLSMVISCYTFASDSATELLKNNGCTTCHAVSGIKKAPPFVGIARRNSRRSADPKSAIINSIKNGSQGKYPMFSDTKMPAFSYLTDEQLNTLADWILKQAPANRGIRRGRGRGMGGGMGRGMM
ncbi:MAG: cytochrome c [Epsilonproteobacteria bacterium]|nr:cytochrome c [Campylobacterota bacterium]